MTVNELLELLQDCGGDAEVRIMSQEAAGARRTLRAPA
jgi:hypothetical protein